MTIIQRIITVWIVITTISVGMPGRNLFGRQVTETRTFCAYGRIFVEFEDNGNTWGTLMLDMRGHPMPCKDDTELTPAGTII